MGSGFVVANLAVGGLHITVSTNRSFTIPRATVLIIIIITGITLLAGFRNPITTVLSSDYFSFSQHKITAKAR